MNKKMLYERINEHVPIGTWFTLNEVCEMINSPSKTLVKTTMFAMPNIDMQKVLMDDSPIRSPKTDKWQWIFKRIE